MISNIMEANFYFDGQTEGVMIVIQEILKLNNKKVNRINTIKILEKLNLDDYTEAILNTYF